jgi:hypothetical protein
VEAILNTQRKLTLVITTGAIALGAGHYVQNKAGDRAQIDVPPVVVTSVMPVAAGPADVPRIAAAVQPPALPAEAAPASQPGATEATAVATTDSAAAPVTPELAAPPATDLAEADECAMKFDLIPQPGAMIGITLLAPCHPDQRVVLQHAGLAVTGRTSPSGALYTVLPALTADATVEVIFGAGEKVRGGLVMEDFAGIQRFAAQWQDKDAFQLHGFENGAGYDQPGHISAAFTGKAGESGVLTLLGDAGVDLPLLAEVFTFGPAAKTDVVLEAAVTEGTCGREILGEMILAKDGTVETTELSVAMPDCDAVGDILVLKNLLQDMTLAAAN